MRENATYVALGPVVEVLDTIDRAREHGELEPGLQAVADQLERAVRSAGLVKYGEPGDAFDPRLHEALSHMGEDPEVEVTTVKVIAKAGYRIGDRVVRVAQVLVVDPARRLTPAAQGEHRPRRGGEMATDNMRVDWAQKDFYGELGVSRSATHDEIKKAYRKLARANHPDSNPGDTAKHEKFKKVAEAYDVVGDETKRQQYDEVRQAYGGGFAGTTAGGARLRPRTTCSASAVAASATSSATSSVPAAAPTAEPVPARCGASTSSRTATIGFDDALGGVTISLRLTSDSACPDCHGTGGKPGTQPKICPECEGAGFVVNSTGGGFLDERDLPTLRRVASSSTTRPARPATAPVAARRRARSRPASRPG